MQVDSTTNTAYIDTNKKTSQTQEPKVSSEKKFDMSKPFDINSFTFKDYKAINGDDLKDWVENSNLPKETVNKITSLSSITSYSDDDTLNEVLFNKLNASYDKGEDFGDFMISVLMPIADMHAGIDKPINYENTLMNPEVAEAFKNDPKNWSYSLSGGGKSSLDYSFKSEDLLNYMEDFPEFYKKIEEIRPGFYKNPDATTHTFNEIIAEYTKRKNEQNSTLEAYTRNTKQNPISL